MREDEAGMGMDHALAVEKWPEQLGVVERVDELLQTIYRSAPLGRLRGLSAELACVLLGLDELDSSHQRAFERIGDRYPDGQGLHAATAAQLAPLVESAGIPRQQAEAAAAAFRCLGQLERTDDSSAVSVGAQLAAIPGLDETSARRLIEIVDGHGIADDPYSRAIIRRLGLAPDAGSGLMQVPEALQERLRLNLAHHARAVCRADEPACQDCPLISFCRTGRESLQLDARPVAVEFFGGAGGLAKGFADAGFRVAVAVEMDRNAAQTHRANHPGTVVLERDARTVTAADIRGAAPWMKDVAAVIGGPPCQGYSVAGKRDPEDDKNDLFKFQVDIAAELKAQFVVIENVPGMRQVKGVRFADRVVRRLARKGFRTTFAPVRASDYGVPQLRHRLIFIAQSSNQPGSPPPVPLGEFCGSLHDPCRCKRQKVPTVLQCLDGLPKYAAGVIAEYVPEEPGYVPPVPGLPLLNGSTMAHGQAVIDKISRIAAGKGPISYRRLHPDLARTIVAGHRALPVHPELDRTISVREAARIQGFPDDYVFCGKRGTQPLQVANAVPSVLGRAIAASLLARLLGEEDVAAHPGVDPCGPASHLLLA